jgi:ElaB/YqjD/DUF883 family membrane-anchored ribosome-binding protein
MGEDQTAVETEQIKRRIDSERADLDRNVDELRRKVNTEVQKLKTEADWHTQFARRPMAVLGVAFAVGFLLSRMTGSRS